MLLASKHNFTFFDAHVAIRIPRYDLFDVTAD